MATRRNLHWLFLATVSIPISLPIILLPNFSQSKSFEIWEYDFTEFSLQIQDEISPKRKVEEES